MAESSDISFHGFESEEIRNLPPAVMFTGSVETAPATESQCNSESHNVSVRQVDASVIPSVMITPADP